MKLKQALIIGRDDGLVLVQEVYNNINLHRRIFGDAEIKDEMQELHDDIEIQNIERSETITRALEIIEEREKVEQNKSTKGYYCNRYSDYSSDEGHPFGSNDRILE